MDISLIECVCLKRSFAQHQKRATRRSATSAFDDFLRVGIRFYWNGNGQTSAILAHQLKFVWLHSKIHWLISHA
jgi:hypothetical protein